MTKKGKNLDLESLELPKEIIEEGRAWVRKNKGHKCSDKGEYDSPRVSSEIMDCSMPMTFDSYSYCSLGCQYCFAYYQKVMNPSKSKVDKATEIQLKSINIKKFEAAITGSPARKKDTEFYKHFYKRRFLLHWGGLSDPFCNFELANWKSYDIIKILGRENYPTLFSFKGNAIMHKKFRKIFGKYADQNNFAFQCSIITADETLAKMVETGVPTPNQRLEMLKMLSDMGYWTILRLRPFILGVTDLHLDELLEKAYAAGVKGISTEFVSIESRANEDIKKRYAWMAKLIGVDNLQQYFHNLSPSERGGYMRLNRLVKEPYIKKMYKFCAERDMVFGCSDPDFKELNTSGSCCGMPDKHPANKGLENWTRSQLTYHLKELRKAYHKTGKLKKLRFKEVFADESYLDSEELAQCHVSVIQRCRAERIHLTQRTIIQETWNNLKSPGNPRNYFHGKVLPCGLDSDGNFIFKYNPLPYEERWKEEGIDLTR